MNMQVRKVPTEWFRTVDELSAFYEHYGGPSIYTLDWPQIIDVINGYYPDSAAKLLNPAACRVDGTWQYATAEWLSGLPIEPQPPSKVTQKAPLFDCPEWIATVADTMGWIYQNHDQSDYRKHLSNFGHSFGD